jgi:hypothetical protein
MEARKRHVVNDWKGAKNMAFVSLWPVLARAEINQGSASALRASQ